MSVKLEPCPFCGSKNLVDTFNDYNSFIIYCFDCGTDGPLGNTSKESIEKWNDRLRGGEVKKNENA